MLNTPKFKVMSSVTAFALLFSSSAAFSRDISHTEIAEALITQYGSLENAIINADKLAVYQQNALQSYITDLELSKLQATNQNTERLEQQAAQFQKKTIFNQKKLESDPSFVEEMRKLDWQRLIAQNKLLHKPPESLIDTISFDPSLPQDLLLQVYPGFPGSISFFDQTGAPWPIVFVKQGTNGAFIAEKTPGNAYSLEARLPGVTNSGWFQLEGLDTTIPFRITSEKTDFFNSRRQVVIPLIGPNAKPIEYRSTSSVDLNDAGPEFFSFLSGSTTGVAGAKNIELVGISGQAFSYEKFVYIRTTATLRGKGSSLIREGSIGNINLYKLHPRAFYWFSEGGRKVRAVVRGHK